MTNLNPITTSTDLAELFKSVTRHYLEAVIRETNEKRADHSNDGAIDYDPDYAVECLDDVLTDALALACGVDRCSVAEALGLYYDPTAGGPPTAEELAAPPFVNTNRWSHEMVNGVLQSHDSPSVRIKVGDEILLEDNTKVRLLSIGDGNTIIYDGPFGIRSRPADGIRVA
jgi:hypothetical protein